MVTSPDDNWDRVRQSFAEQFEREGTNYVYRRSQKGEAIRVSAEERTKFIDEFDQNIGRFKWIIYLGLALVLGVVIGFPVLSGAEFRQTPLYVGLGIVLTVYFAYYRWAWAAPARELAGRTPIAGERDPEEFRRLRFQRITYGQLAGAAFGGLALPFLVSSRQEILSGWNRLWLVFGAAIILFSAVQAFRKWRIEEADSYTNLIPQSSEPDVAEPADGAESSQTKDQLWRYVPFALIVLGLVFVGLTSAGKQFARRPEFWAIVMVGCGCWALLTVARGFAIGRIEPFVRGFYKTYERETEPKRFWASMAWNAIFGGGCLWLAVAMNQDTAAEAVRNRCYNDGHKYQPREALSACNQIIDNGMFNASLTRADAFLDRAIAHDDLQEATQAITDYTAALRAQPRYFEAYYDRGIVYEEVGDHRSAITDYTAAIRIRPDADAYLNRGIVYGRVGNTYAAIADFDEAIRLAPKSAEGYYYRAIAYRQIGDKNRATADFEVAFRLDPKLCGGCATTGG